jgi:TonB family protein
MVRLVACLRQTARCGDRCFRGLRPAGRCSKEEAEMNLRAIVTLFFAVVVCGAAPSRFDARKAPSQTGDQAQIPKRIRIGGVAASAHRIHTVTPKYPQEAKRKGIEGKVRLEALIGQDGKVENLKPIEGDPLLTESALAAVKKWRFKPFTIQGRPVEVETEIDVNFTLHP